MHQTATAVNGVISQLPMSSSVIGEPVAQEEQQQNILDIVIPKPDSSEQLDQILYRYRAILSYPKENEAEINAIEATLGRLSVDQDVFSKQLQDLRSNIKSDSIYNDNLLEKQILALQLLEKDLDIPAELLQSYVDRDDTLINGDKTSKPILNPVNISLDFNSNATNLDLDSKFENIIPTKLGNSCTEVSISSQIGKRISELERLPANLGTYSLEDSLEFNANDEISAGIDELRIKALLELKSLKLLTKQKALRQKLITNVTSQAHHTIPSLRDSPFTMAAQRSVQVSGKVVVPQTVKLAEELERQQLLEKRKKERNKHLTKINVIVESVTERQNNPWNRRERCMQFGKIVQTVHIHIEKEEQKRVERTAKQRLAALKSNDEEAYLKLLDQTKDTRITQLLRQTNSFLDTLAEKVRVQQNQAKILNGEEVPPITDEEREKIDYYGVAHTVKETIDKQPSMLVGGTLKEYQLKGLEWMVSLYNNHLNGILADEMGLGKTIQSISLITYLFEVKKELGPFLVIVPLSTITNWTLEFEKWAPSLNTIIYKGTPNQRRNLQQQIRMGDFDVLLTTYEYIIRDRALLAKHEWAHMIIDEGHRMKNAQSKLSYTIQHYYHTRNRLILTGTPLQNNLPELWALLNFVLPKIFNSAKTFDDWFNTPFANTGTQEKLELTEEETLLIIRRLHKVLRPFLLRRLKKEVEKDLPDKVEKVIKCKLSGLQQQLYQQMLKYNALFVGAGTEGATKGGIKGLNNKIMQLRKICNHPFVFDEVEGVINPTRANSNLLYRVSGKFELLNRVLPKFKATGHRVLMFFQMTQVMDIMEDFLRIIGLKYMRLDGATKADDRTEMLKLFNAPNSDYFCFLLSTRAGGLGLNLQTADTVIIFDTDWNPHQDLQAQDRAHRIGQKNEVRILRLITTDSVEEVILERATQKLNIDGKVIQAGKFDNKSTAEEQEEFLRRLIENETTKEEDEDDAELDDEELNEILARSEEERVLFDKMDQERTEQEKIEAKSLGLKKPLSRLIQTEELPQVFTEDISDHLQTEPVVVGRVRERKRVYYDDGLTEEQFLQAVEDNSGTLEEAIEKKREGRERRKQVKESKDGELDTLENTPVPMDLTDLTENGSTAVEDSNGAKTNGRGKRFIKEDDASDDYMPKEDAVDNIEPEKKRPKMMIKLTLKKQPKPKAETTVINGNSKTKTTSKTKGSNKKTFKPEPCEFTLKVEALFAELRKEVSEIDGHARTFIFEKLPSKRQYPDYYAVIENPVAIETIIKRCKAGVYKDLTEVKEDFNTMYNNARKYNEVGSWVCEDASKLNEITDEWFDVNKN